MMPAATPMGPAARGSRLDRLAQGQAIVRRLRDRGWTLMRISERTGIAVTTLSKIRLGRRAPSKAQLEALRELVR